MAHEPLPQVTLTGRHVQLEPLSLDHLEALVQAAAIDRSTYQWTWVPEDRASMERYITTLLTGHAAGEMLPFVQRDLASGAPIGCTRMMDLRWVTGRPEPDELEVGGTWLAASAQRTPINTEAKLLMFTHAFDTLGAWRVMLATDASNTRSRNAIERVGARFEGVLRNHRSRQGDHHPHSLPITPRDTAVFAITRDDWPEVRRALSARLDR